MVLPESLLRACLRVSIDTQEGFEVSNEANDLYDALEQIADTQFDLVVSGLRLPGPSGIELVHEFRRRRILVPVILLSDDGTAEAIKQAMLAGVQGYVLKTGCLDDLFSAMQRVLEGKKFMPPQLTTLPLPNNYYNIASRDSKSDPLEALTPREREVFHMLAVGIRNNDIAKRLYISPRTVETHRARITKKLEISSNGELVRYAIRHGLSSA